MSKDYSEEILEQVEHNRKVPNVNDMARSMVNINVEYANWECPSNEVIVGLYNILDNCGSMVINKGVSSEEQRFAVAYLIAKRELNGKNIDFAYREELYQKGPFYDEEAYKYALNLIVPDSVLESDICFIDLAREYEVPYCVMEQKIKRKSL